MSPYSAARDPSDFSHQRLDGMLRLCRKRAKSRDNWRAFKARGAVKDYIEVDCLLAMKFHARWISEDFYLLFHRVPRSVFWGGPSDACGIGDNELPGPQRAGDVAANGEAGGVLPVGYFSELSRNVFIGRTRVQSAVWLESEKRRPELFRDLTAFSSQSLFTPGFRIRPREIDCVVRSDCLVDGGTSGEGGLVKGVPKAEHGFVKAPLNLIKREINCPDVLNNLLLRFRVNIGPSSIWVETEKVPNDRFKLIESFYTPSERFLGTTE